MTSGASGERVLVTGGCGFLGRAVVAGFLANGVDVVVADHKPFPLTPGVTSLVGDLADPAFREEAMSTEPAGVVHLAATTSVLRSIEQPAHTFAMNVEVTHGLLESVRLRGVGKFVLASTTVVAGDVRGVITENLPVRPMTPYGASKAACEALLSGYARSYGIAGCALRFTNIYGPGMITTDTFVARLMRAAVVGGGVGVYGDGRQVRDLVHVDDAVAGVLAAWQRSYPGTAIIGSGRPVSVLEMIDATRAVTGATLPVSYLPAPDGEQPAVIVDISRARADLGYVPTVELVDGMRTVWADFRSTATEIPLSAG
jgi:UDP-glucose 4-epimerase